LAPSEPAYEPLIPVEVNMGEQNSQKRGVRSDAQKETDAREGYNQQPSTSETPGAFGHQSKRRQSDQDLALTKAQKQPRKQQ